ncbi:MAG: hypothetical protein R3F13_15080 [Prosthecobacter sp.]
MSPIYHITKALPPIFITHGGADTLVPLDQSTAFGKSCRTGPRSRVDDPSRRETWLAHDDWDAHLFAQWIAEHLEVNPARESLDGFPSLVREDGA